MRFSLIMATLGRTREIRRFLVSLDAQSHQDFELILVDQNPDDRLVPLLAPYRERTAILHLRSELGVSLARNVGLRHLSGDVVGFPDDDCHYPPDLLERIAGFLQKHPEIDGISGTVSSESGSFDARFDDTPGPLSLFNTWQRTAAVSLFLRSRAIESIGGFDTTLGPNSGTIWGGGEDIDYALRAVGAGFMIRYEPDLVVLHPDPLEGDYTSMIGRAYSYGAGIGRVWRKHGYPIWLVAYYLLRPFGGAIIGLSSARIDKAHYHWSALRGRLRGWLSRN